MKIVEIYGRNKNTLVLDGRALERNDLFFSILEERKKRMYGRKNFDSSDSMLLALQEQLQITSFPMANLTDPFHSLIPHFYVFLNQF